MTDTIEKKKTTRRSTTKKATEAKTVVPEVKETVEKTVEPKEIVVKEKKAMYNVVRKFKASINYRQFDAIVGDKVELTEYEAQVLKSHIEEIE